MGSGRTLVQGIKQPSSNGPMSESLNNLPQCPSMSCCTWTCGRYLNPRAGGWGGWGASVNTIECAPQGPSVWDWLRLGLSCRLWLWPFRGGFACPCYSFVCGVGFGRPAWRWFRLSLFWTLFWSCAVLVLVVPPGGGFVCPCFWILFWSCAVLVLVVPLGGGFVCPCFGFWFAFYFLLTIVLLVFFLRNHRLHFFGKKGKFCPRQIDPFFKKQKLVCLREI